MASNAEIAVIGSILIDPKVLRKASVLSLRVDDFSDTTLRKVFGAIQYRESEGLKIDLIPLATDAGVEADVLLRCMEITPTATNVSEYAEILKSESAKRKLMDAAFEVSNDLSGTLAQKVSALTDVLHEIEADRQGLQAVDMMQASRILLDWQKRAKAGFVNRTGYATLDKLLGGGIMAGGLYVIGARPGMGKTQIGLNLCNKLIEDGSTCLFLSLEMTIPQIMARLVAIRNGMHSQQLLLRPDELTEEDWQKVFKTTQELSERNMFINDKVHTMEDIETVAKSIPDLKYLCIDYLGLIKSPDNKASRYEAMTEVSAGLKTMAKKLNIPVIILAQLNREVAGRNRHKPQMSDLRDTGAIEQDADAIILLHRESYYNDASPTDGITPDELEVILAKNRYGQTANVKMDFYLASGRITER